MIYIINSPVLTDFGLFEYKPFSVEEVKLLLKTRHYTSAIGHETTALFLTKLLECEINSNRIAITQKLEDSLIVFKLKMRGPANKEYSIGEMEAAGYEFGLLTKLK